MKMKVFWIAIAGVVSMAGVAKANPLLEPTVTWDFSIASPSDAPFAGEEGSGGPGYLITCLEATDQSNGNSNSFCEEFDVPAAPEYEVTIDNGAGDDSGLLSDAGFFISESYIPLDQLNFGFEPPPFSAGSHFIPLPGLDGQTLQGGDGIGFDVTVPEPTSLPLLGAAGALALIRRRRKSYS